MNNAIMDLPRSTLGNTCVSVTRLGFGAASLGNLYQPLSTENALAAIGLAWDSGIRYFDTAPFYGFGLSERRVGDALRERANDYVISTKVGRLMKPCEVACDKYGFCSPMPFEPIYDYSYDGVMRSFDDSIQRLGLSRIDILYMHDIGSLTHGEANATLFRTAMDGGYRAMHELREQGVVKAIGLGVNECEVCEAAMNYGEFDCFLLAGRYTLLEQHALNTFLPRCAKNTISVVVGGPYNSGILASGTRSTPRASLTYNYETAPDDVVLKVQALERVCDEFDIPLAAAALQFPLAHPCVAAVIPGLGSTKRVNATQALFATSIPDDFWSVLKSRNLLQHNAPVPVGS